MNFEREPWRPMFMREPVERRRWRLVTRGLRAYLIQVAEDDGTLLKRCDDPGELAASLGVHADEEELVRAAIELLLGDGFLRWEGDGGWLGVDRLVTFGGEPEPELDCEPTHDAPEPGEEDCPEAALESAEARRRRKARERKARSRGRRRPPGRVTKGVTESVTGGVTSVTESVTLERDQRDRERDHGASAVPARTFTMPSEEPPREFLDEAQMAGVPPDQAKSTWKHYAAAGLPATGVEKLRPWLIQRAIEYRNSRAKVQPSGLRSTTAPLEPSAKHRAFAEQHGIDADAIVAGILEDQLPEKIGLAEARKNIEQRLSIAAWQKRTGRAVTGKYASGQLEERRREAAQERQREGVPHRKVGGAA